MDDYDEPIPQVGLKHDNINTDHDDDDSFEKDSEKVDRDYGKPDADEAEDVDDEPEDDDDDGPKTAKRSKVPQLAVDEVPPSKSPPQSRDTPKDEHEEERAEPKLGPDFRSLLVKVYRGPTKQINEKPFASWGYFVKYPSEDEGKGRSSNGSSSA